jgi:hypothetical protein
MSDPDSERRSLSRGEWAAVVLAVLVVAAALWVWLRKPGGEQAPPAVQPAAESTPPPPAQESRPPAPVPDAEARSRLEALSSDPVFRRWLGTAEDIVRRWAIATDNLAQGVSPRKVLEPAGPKASFRVVQRGARSFMSAESYARYDEFARTVASVSPQGFATVYTTLKPAIEFAYHALGYPSGSLDAATTRALRRIETAPVVDKELEVAPERGVFVFVDPKLEGLTQVDKHLLRMGPRNTRLIQAKARAIREALNLPAEAANAASAK